MKTEKSRPLCKCGQQLPINYKKNGKTYYRKMCTNCAKEEKKPKQQEWEIAGYLKKSHCEKCGFKAKYENQIAVIKIKGGLYTFKSVCLNCEAEITITGKWHQGDLTPDL